MTNQQDIQSGLDIPIASGQVVQQVEGRVVGVYNKASASGKARILSIMLLDTRFLRTLSPMPDGQQFSIECLYATNFAPWGALTDSLILLLGEGMTFRSIQEKRVEFTWVEDIPGRIQQGGQWVDGLQEGWIATAVDGKRHPELDRRIANKEVQMEAATAPVVNTPPETLDDYFLGLAVGKEPADAVHAALSDDSLQNTEYLQLVLNENEGAWSRYVAEGKLRLDGDPPVFVKVE